MEDIFEPRRTKLLRALRAVLPAVVPVLICVLFFAAVSRTSSDTVEKEQAVLLEALQNGAVHAYALTGNYPESLEQLLKAYRITYDERKFIVEYVPNGSNLFPSIAVIPLSHEKGGGS